MTTYTELKQQLLDYAETDNQVLTDVILNDIINHAENRIFRTIELDNTKDYLNGNTAANSRFITLPGYSVSDPTKPSIEDITNIRYVTLYTDSGTKERHELVRVDVDFLNEYYPTPETGSAAKPRYYATWDMGQIAIAPTPNAVYKFEIGTIKKLSGLSSSNTETWVSVNAPRVILYACLCEVFKYLKAPQEQAVYEQSFKEAITELAQEQLGKKRRDEYRDGSLRMNIPTTNP